MVAPVKLAHFGLILTICAALTAVIGSFMTISQPYVPLQILIASVLTAISLIVLVSAGTLIVLSRRNDVQRTWSTAISVLRWWAPVGITLCVAGGIIGAVAIRLDVTVLVIGLLAAQNIIVTQLLGRELLRDMPRLR
ncbi:hypothetical protein [Trueperella sp. LYQ141]|uniref:hypothetical protein n=1 Tax=Trueperella sp. LYQ141 TaxID=3391058 RepID=UPI0039839D4E